MNATELVEALDRLVEPLPAPAALSATTLRRGARRRQAKLAGGGSLAAAAVAGVALLVLPGAGPDRVVPPAERPTATAGPSAEPTPTVPPTVSPTTAPTAPPMTSPSDRPIVEAPPQLSPGPEPTPDASAPTVVLQGDGLGLVTATGSNRMLLFGEADPQVLQDALARALGPGTPSPQPDCGAAVTTVSYGGFQVLLEDDRFAGWSLNGAEQRLATGIGLGPGSTLAELRDDLVPLTVEQTTLGTEWSGGGFGGVLDGATEDSRVTSMWAGRTCIFR